MYADRHEGTRIIAVVEAVKPIIGYQRWHSLLFLHWPVPESALRPLVPDRLSIDTFDGRAYVTVTPFTVRNARVRFAPPIPGAHHFHELNVRTYVRFRGRDSGIWFFSLEAASALAVALARVALRLPYRRACMGRIERGGSHEYRSWRRTGRARVRGISIPCERAELRASWSVEGERAVAQPGTLEHELVERYFLYSRGLGGKLWQGEVRHDPWSLRSVADLRVEQSLDAALGLPPLVGKPLARYSEGVNVEFLPFRLV